MPILNNIFQAHYEIPSFEVDPENRVKLPYFLKIMQEGAGKHSDLRGCSIPKLLPEGMTWFLFRLELSISQYPLWQEQLLLKTWAQEPFRFYCPRAFEATDSSGKTVFSALTHWILIDLKTRTPIRPTGMSDRLQLPDQRIWVDPAIHRITVDEQLNPDFTFTPQIQFRDTDLNEHVNNIVYGEWLLESFPPSWKEEYCVEHITIRYLVEAFLHDAIEIRTTRVPNSDGIPENSVTFTHSMIRYKHPPFPEAGDSHITGKETPEYETSCIAKTVWRRKGDLPAFK